jgi:Icc protein
MRILQISDCHIFSDISKCGYQQINPYHSLQKVLIEVSNYKPDMLLITGDVSGDGSEQSYQHFKSLLSKCDIQVPWIVLAGNHDAPEILKKQFHANNLGLSRSIPLVNLNWQCHFVNSHYQGTLGLVAQTDLDELAQRLMGARDDNHIVFVHHHPIQTGSWMDKHEFVNRQQFVEVLESHAQVKAVAFGHVHQAIDKMQNSIRYLGCPSTCWQWANKESFAVANETAGFRVIDLAADGQLNTFVQRVS